MKARLYSKTAKTPKQPLRGQAERVYKELSTTPEFATAISERIEKSDTPLTTRQLPYRVTLYYILVFKNQGLVRATEPVDETTEETDNVEETTEETETDK